MNRPARPGARQAQEALELSGERYRNFIVHSLSGIWWYEAEPPMPLDLPVEEQVEWLFRGVRGHSTTLARDDGLIVP